MIAVAFTKKNIYKYVRVDPHAMSLMTHYADGHYQCEYVLVTLQLSD